MKKRIESNKLSGRFQSLISQYAELRSCREGRFANLLDLFRTERQNWAASQLESADDFNLFGVIGVERDELCHSTILAWLLDHRIAKGTHAQGALGFRLFLEEFATELQVGDKDKVLAYADERNYWVSREVSGDEARVDIEIAALGKFVIQIENKIDSEEGTHQTNREWRDLQARRIELHVPEKACHAIFLTPDGTEAKNENFLAVDWNRIAQVFDRFANEAKPSDVKLFARHYARTIRMLSLSHTVEVEALDDDV